MLFIIACFVDRVTILFMLLRNSFGDGRVLLTLGPYNRLFLSNSWTLVLALRNLTLLKSIIIYIYYVFTSAWCNKTA